MKAMVLAAGLGTRLRPLTERWPKPAIPFLGLPLLRYTFAVLRRAGVTSVGLNTHHLPEVLRQTAEHEGQRASLAIRTVHEPVIQGTGGGIRGLREFLQSEDVFVVFNGDILFSVDLKPLVEEHRSSGAAATMLLLPMPSSESYAAVEMNAAGHVRRIAGKGPGGDKLTPWHFTGVHLMSPAVFDFMSPSGPEDINREVYPRLMAKGLVVRGAVVQGYWSDLGTPTRYLGTQRDVLLGQVPLEAFGSASPFLGTTPGSGHQVRLGAGAQVRGSVVGPALLDRGALVESSAQLGSAVYLGRDSRVGEGARVNRACVFEDTVLGPEEELVEAIAWGRHRIPAPL